MKKLISILACITLLMSLVSCKKDNQQNQDKSIPIKSIGETVIDDTTYNFYYNAYKTQINDDAKAREMANKEIQNMYIPLEVAKKMGLGAELKDEFINQIRGEASDEEWQEYLNELGVDNAFIDKYAEAIASNMAIEDYVSANVKADIDKDTFFKENYLRAKHVLIMTEGLSDDEKAEKKKLAQDILERAEGKEDFDALIKEYSEDPGSQSQPDGYVFPEGQMVDEFYQGTKNIKIGEYNLVESSYGYHIIKRLALDETPELYEKFISEADVENEMQSSIVENFIKEKQEEFNIEVKY